MTDVKQSAAVREAVNVAKKAFRKRTERFARLAGGSKTNEGSIYYFGRH